MRPTVALVADVSDQDLSGARLERVTLTGASFERVTFEDATFRRCN